MCYKSSKRKNEKFLSMIPNVIPIHSQMLNISNNTFTPIHKQLILIQSQSQISTSISPKIRYD